MIANSHLEVRQINLTIKPLSGRDANVIVLHAQFRIRVAAKRDEAQPLLRHAQAVASFGKLPKVQMEHMAGGAVGCSAWLDRLSS